MALEKQFGCILFFLFFGLNFLVPSMNVMLSLGIAFAAAATYAICIYLINNRNESYLTMYAKALIVSASMFVSIILYDGILISMKINSSCGLTGIPTYSDPPTFLMFALIIYGVIQFWWIIFSKDLNSLFKHINNRSRSGLWFLRVYWFIAVCVMFILNPFYCLIKLYL